MSRIWTEEDKTEMRRQRNAGFSNASIGYSFGVSGDVIRKVLARFLAKRGVKTPQERLAEHELSAHRQYRALCGIMPKDFQK